MRQQQQLQSAAAVAAEDEFQRLLRERPDDVDTLYKVVASLLRSPGHVAAQFFSGLVDAFARTFGDPAALKALEGQSHEHIEEATKKMEMEAHSIPRTLTHLTH